MTLTSPFTVVLSSADYRTLTRRAARATSAARDVLRSRIVLAAHAGHSNAKIARGLQITVDTVRKWRRRYHQGGVEGLKDLPRSGRPPVFSTVAVAEVKAMACALPAEYKVPLSRWSHSELASEAISRGILDSVSTSTIRRWLTGDAIKPWQYQSWIFPRDPDFQTKAARVLDLYARTWNGVPLGDDEYVISADEKSQLQALHRCHPDLAPAPGRIRRQEFEYQRKGTLAYLAAYDVHNARVFGRCAETTGIVPFNTLVEQVMTTEPYASAKRVFWVVDNGSSHNGARSIQRMTDAWPTAVLVHLPIHASWLNQVEIYFSIVQRKVVKPQDFDDLHDLEHRLLRFQSRYNLTAVPFDWRFSRHALHNLIDRINHHEKAAA
jgi:transposase